MGTIQDIIMGVKNLDMVYRSNPTLSGLGIVIGALRDYAKEARQINEAELSNYLEEQAGKLEKKKQEVGAFCVPGR